LVRGYENEAYRDRNVDRPDFEEVENVAFPPKGNSTPPYITPAHDLAHTFKFKSYSPKIFKQLREFFDIDPVDYMNSICGKFAIYLVLSSSL
jgi:1-phosphatidylinositol-4-phosphate 5-kinase